MLLLTLPGLLYFCVFHYVPLLGYVVAFQDYQPYLGYMHSAWAGVSNFTPPSPTRRSGRRPATR